MQLDIFLLLQRCARFLQFLSSQSSSSSSSSGGGGGGGGRASSAAVQSSSTQQLQRHMETLTSHYIALEEFFVCSQVVKAIRRAHPDRPDALPQLADDAMFIVTRSCTRALSTQLPHAVSATVSAGPFSPAPPSLPLHRTPPH